MYMMYVIVSMVTYTLEAFNLIQAWPQTKVLLVVVYLLQSKSALLTRIYINAVWMTHLVGYSYEVRTSALLLKSLNSIAVKEGR